MPPGAIVSVHRSSTHTFSKARADRLTLVAGLGVAGDAHSGSTVKHRSRVAIDPTQPNLRQVHLMHSELFEELAAKGFVVQPGDIGENVLTRGVDLLGLPVGTVLRLGPTALVALTGLRNPCGQLHGFQEGLTAALLDRDEAGNVVRKAGVMAVVLAGGEIAPGDEVVVALPPEPHQPLDRV